MLVYKFVIAVEAFIDRFEVDRANTSTVHSVLFNCLCRDAPLTTKGDPDERVQKLFAQIDGDILELCSKFSYKREEIVWVYFTPFSTCRFCHLLIADNYLSLNIYVKKPQKTIVHGAYARVNHGVRRRDAPKAISARA